MNIPPNEVCFYYRWPFGLVWAFAVRKTSVKDCNMVSLSLHPVRCDKCNQDFGSSLDCSFSSSKPERHIDVHALGKMDGAPVAH